MSAVRSSFVVLFGVALVGVQVPTLFAQPAADVSSEPIALGPLPGIVSSPIRLSGNRRWQLFTKNPSLSVGAVAWSPDSRWFAMATGHIVRIYDATDTSQFERILVGHTESVRAVRYSADGRFIATASLDGTARLWSVEGQEVLVYRKHNDSVQDVSWHPDGQRLATASVDGTVHIWSVDGKMLKILKQHEAAVNAVAWSSDGKRLASGCENQTIRMWSEEGKEGPVLTGHVGAIESLAWNPKQDWLLSCDHGAETVDGNQEVADLKVWDGNGTEIATTRVIDAPPSHVCWNPDGTDAIAGGFHSIIVWTISSNATRQRQAPAAVSVPVAYRPSGGLFIAGPILNNDATGQSETLSLRSFPIYGVDVALGDKRISIGCGDQTFYLFDHTGLNLHHSKPLMQNGIGVYSCRFSPDGKTLATGTRMSQEVHFFDINGNPSRASIKIPGFYSRCIAWSSDGKKLAVGGDRATVGLVDITKGTVALLGQQRHGITQVQFEPDQEHVCSAGFDSCVRFWTLDGKQGTVIEATAAPIRGMDWSDDGTRLVTGHEDNSIRLWNPDGSAEAVIGGHGSYVESVDFNSEGTKFASGSWDHTVRIWKRDGTPISVLRGHEGALGMVKWSHDDKRIYSGAADGTVRCWDAESGIASWTILFGNSGKSVTLDSIGHVIHGDKTVLESDFVAFAENGQGRLVRTPWDALSKEIQMAGKQEAKSP